MVVCIFCVDFVLKLRPLQVTLSQYFCLSGMFCQFQMVWFYVYVYYMSVSLLVDLHWFYEMKTK